MHTTDPRFIDADKATIRGLSSTELTRMLNRAQRQPDVPDLDRNQLRDIGLERGAS